MLEYSILIHGLFGVKTFEQFKYQSNDWNLRTSFVMHSWFETTDEVEQMLKHLDEASVTAPKLHEENGTYMTWTMTSHESCRHIKKQFYFDLVAESWDTTHEVHHPTTNFLQLKGRFGDMTNTLSNTWRVHCNHHPPALVWLPICCLPA